MEPLTVPSPDLVFDPPGGPPELEKPIDVRVAPIRFADAQTLAQADVQKIGLFVYRGVVDGEEVWDEGAQSWRPSPSDLDALQSLSPVPLISGESAADPWKGLLVAAGQKDKDGNARFGKAAGGAPRYRLRAFASAKRGGVMHRGLSSASLDLLFTSAADAQRFAVVLDTGNARDCGRARLRLRNSSLAEAGFVEIRAAGGQEVDIANCDASGNVLARVRLAANGDILLDPAPGGRVFLGGLLEANLIRYQPQGGGPRVTL